LVAATKAKIAGLDADLAEMAQVIYREIEELDDLLQLLGEARTHNKPGSNHLLGDVARKMVEHLEKHPSHWFTGAELKRLYPCDGYVSVMLAPLIKGNKIKVRGQGKACEYSVGGA
jgi:hypothetical protein